MLASWPARQLIGAEGSLAARAPARGNIVGRSPAVGGISRILVVGQVRGAISGAISVVRVGNAEVAVTPRSWLVDWPKFTTFHTKGIRAQRGVERLLNMRHWQRT